MGKSYLFRDYGFSLLGIGFAAAAVMLLGVAPARPLDHCSGFSQVSTIGSMAAMQPGTDAGSIVGDRASQVRPGDIKGGSGVKSDGGDGGDTKSRAVDARKQSMMDPDGAWSASLKPT